MAYRYVGLVQINPQKSCSFEYYRSIRREINHKGHYFAESYARKVKSGVK